MSVDDVLSDAEQHPEVFIDARAQLSESERRDYAVRSAAADLAVRLATAENTVRGWGEAARRLRSGARRVWAAYREGEVSVANARVIADTLGTLPDESRTAFEDLVVDAATRLAPARFRAVARAARERVHHEAIADRHLRAASLRRVVVEDDLDGMSWLSVYLTSATAHRALAVVDGAARSIQGSDDRTLDQVRADVAGELLMGLASGVGSAVSVTGVSISVTVPVMTLLDQSDEPGILHGVGPIDADTARLLAAEATSFQRILTHPVTGAVLELDRTLYRVPADLKRLLTHRDRTCRFAGCGRRADRCDVDHIVEWQDGGMTDASNLMHLCRHHHRLKSVAGWKPTAGTASDAITWTSPTHEVTQAIPPPF
ncbi:MAG: HNH endonuclease [Actinomycetota bacterium]|nr:HNH endonuclease [Actinomycetota bacterium]